MDTEIEVGDILFKKIIIETETTPIEPVPLPVKKEKVQKKKVNA